jgi:redox-sensitive bicupin YhaK (pirin superfamily)
MIKTIRYSDLGASAVYWLDTKHHFSFDGYYNPERMGFGHLRVVNYDIVMPQYGFDTHPHKNMEIITYVTKGTITHRDSCGNYGKIKPGSIQVMSAGKGIFHSEYNLEDEVLLFYQIWIEPRQKNTKPKYQNLDIDYKLNNLVHISSGSSETNNEKVLYIDQDVDVYTGKFSKNASCKYNIVRQLYIIVVSGEIKIGSSTAKTGDAMEVINENEIIIEFIENSQVILIDVAKK